MFDAGTFLGNSSLSKAYIVYNNRMSIFEESDQVDFDETRPQKSGKGSLYGV